MINSPTTSTTSTLQCRRCGQAIKFDDRHVSQKTGKKIPLDAQTGQRHDCPALSKEQSQSQSELSLQPLLLQHRQQQQQQQQQQLQPQQPQQQPAEKGKRFLKCSKGCGGEIYFDVNTKTTTGKWMPISKATGLPHQCL
jgi:hypothetical protein